MESMTPRYIFPKRTAIEIIYEILKLRGRHKTYIMGHTSLTFHQTIRYLGLLKTQGLINITKDVRGHELFTATTKGDELVGYLDIVFNMLTEAANG